MSGGSQILELTQAQRVLAEAAVCVGRAVSDEDIVRRNPISDLR